MLELIKRLCGREDRVKFSITLSNNMYKEDVESFLKERNIDHALYVVTTKQIGCSAPKSVYEHVFQTKVIKRMRTSLGRKIKQYEEKTPAQIPRELESKVNAIGLDYTTFYAATI